MFEPVDQKANFPELERAVLAFWREADVFHRQLEQRRGGPLWIFYEGPPTANGQPAIHHTESRTFKDVYPRFRAMTGHFVPRKAGWDCHGLPVELEVEKEIGTKSKRDIEAFGVAEFNRLCRESVQRYVGEFERQTERLGFWIDTDDAYWTMDPDYIESVWWSLKQLHGRGLLFQDDRITTYCPRCGTPLSDAEVAMGYADVEDPSVFVKFTVVESPDPELVGAHLLGWTTTPWTLISNTGVAVAPQAMYVMVEQEGERYVLAEDRLARRPAGCSARGSAVRRGHARRSPVRAAVPERRGRPPRGGSRLRLARGRHRRGPPGAGVRSRGPRDRQARGVGDVQAARRRGPVHRRGPGVRPRRVLQGRRRGHHRRPAFARAAASGRDARRTRTRCAGGATRR